jgi:transcriptional regulator with XRE-family HTH domain
MWGDQDETHDSGFARRAGESRAPLATALGVMSEEVVEWEMGKTEATMSRLRALTEFFGVPNDQINLRRGQGRP